MKRKVIIAIDGTAGSGKSTLAEALSKKLGYTYIDTGAMYRAVAYKSIREHIGRDDKKAIVNIARKIDISIKKPHKIFLDGEDVSRKIRLPEVSALVSKIAAIEGVRKAMVKRQHSIAEKGSIIIEGRDIGTVVFPSADIKFFLLANAEQRAKRRYKELQGKKINSSLKDVQKNIKSRDRQDSTRRISPLKPASDAIIINTSALTIKEKNRLVLNYIKEKIK